MRRITFISGALFSSLTLLGMLFKIMHWPGAGVALTIGVVGLAIVFIPLFAVFKFNKAK